MKLAILLLSVLAVAVLSDNPLDPVEKAVLVTIPPAGTDSTDPHTYNDQISIGSPVAWYPTMLDVIVGFFTHSVQHNIGLYKVVKERLLHHRQMLEQIPPFYDSINLYYDGDHLRSVLSRNTEYEPFRSGLNYTVERPKMALEVIDTVKAIMDNLRHVNY